MTTEERRAALHALIDGHTETMAGLREANYGLAETSRANDAALEAFRRQSVALQRMADAHERAIEASLTTMKAALALLDDALGVQ